MKFFSYKKDNVTRFLTAKEGVMVNSKGNFENPVVLSTKEILAIIEELKADKDAFKDFVAYVTKQDDNKIINSVNNYYNIEPAAILERLVQNIKIALPAEKDIKTNMLMPSGDHFAKIRVLAKKGLKINVFKTYTEDEIKEMQVNGDIAIMDASPYKKANDKVITSRVTTAKDLLFGSSVATIFNFLKNNYKFTYNQVLEDINTFAIKKDLEQKYIPTYKKCIAYLTECAKTAVVHEQQEIKNLQNQIAKSKTVIEDLNNVQKSLLDTSKGR